MKTVAVLCCYRNEFLDFCDNFRSCFKVEIIARCGKVLKAVMYEQNGNKAREYKYIDKDTDPVTLKGLTFSGVIFLGEMKVINDLFNQVVLNSRG